jgi:hypothetical protein
MGQNVMWVFQKIAGNMMLTGMTTIYMHGMHAWSSGDMIKFHVSILLNHVLTPPVKVMRQSNITNSNDVQWLVTRSN